MHPATYHWATAEAVSLNHKLRQALLLRRRWWDPHNIIGTVPRLQNYRPEPRSPTPLHIVLDHTLHSPIAYPAL